MEKMKNAKKKNAYTKTPVTMEARKVPSMANVTIAPKLEKKGFCKERKRKVKEPIWKQKNATRVKGQEKRTYRRETEARLSKAKAQGQGNESNK